VIEVIMDNDLHQRVLNNMHLSLLTQ